MNTVNRVKSSTGGPFILRGYVENFKKLYESPEVRTHEV
jgi:hypothetical protein